MPNNPDPSKDEALKPPAVRIDEQAVRRSGQSRNLLDAPASPARAHGAEGRQHVHRDGVAEEGVDEGCGFPGAGGHEKVAEEEVEAEGRAAAEEAGRDAGAYFLQRPGAYYGQMKDKIVQSSSLPGHRSESRQCVLAISGSFSRRHHVRMAVVDMNSSWRLGYVERPYIRLRAEILHHLNGVFPSLHWLLPI